MGANGQILLRVTDSDLEFLRKIDALQNLGTETGTIVLADPGETPKDGHVDLHEQVKLREAKPPCALIEYTNTYTIDGYQFVGTSARGNLTTQRCGKAVMSQDYRFHETVEFVAAAVFEKYDRPFIDPLGREWGELAPFVMDPSQDLNFQALSDPVYDPLIAYWDRLDSMDPARREWLTKNIQEAVGKTLDEATFTAFDQRHLTPSWDDDTRQRWQRVIRLERLGLNDSAIAYPNESPFDKAAKDLLNAEDRRRLVTRYQETFRAEIETTDRKKERDPAAIRAQQEGYEKAFRAHLKGHPNPFAVSAWRRHIYASVGQIPADLFEQRLEIAERMTAYRALHHLPPPPPGTTPPGGAAKLATIKDLASVHGITNGPSDNDKNFSNAFEQLMADPESTVAEVEALQEAYIALKFCQLPKIELTLDRPLTAKEVLEWRTYYNRGFTQQIIGPVAARLATNDKAPPHALARLRNLLGLDPQAPLDEGTLSSRLRSVDAEGQAIAQSFHLGGINKGLYPKKTLFAPPRTDAEKTAVTILLEALEPSLPQNRYTYDLPWARSTMARRQLKERVVGKVDKQWLKNLVAVLLSHADRDRIRLAPDSRLEWIEFFDSLDRPARGAAGGRRTEVSATETGPTRMSRKAYWIEMGGLVVVGGAALAVGRSSLAVDEINGRERPSATTRASLAIAGAAATNVAALAILDLINPKWTASHPILRRVSAGVGGAAIGFGLSFVVPFSPVFPPQDGEQPPTQPDPDHSRPPGSETEF